MITIKTDCQTASHQQHMRVSVLPHQHLILSDFLIFAILVGVKWWFFCFLFCISLKYRFIHLLATYILLLIYEVYFGDNLINVREESKFHNDWVLYFINICGDMLVDSCENLLYPYRFCCQPTYSN